MSQSLLSSIFSKTVVIIKIAALLLLLGVLLMLAKHLAAEIPSAEAWLRAQGAWAPFFFTLAFCVLPLFLFPTDPLCLAAGLLFGMGLGFLLAGIGMLGSAVLMFGVSRFLAQASIKKLLGRYPKFNRFGKVVELGGMKVLFLMRLAPIPFAPLSYFLGVTRISFRQYFWSIFGTFGTVLVGVYYGSVGRHFGKLVGKTESFSWLRDLSLIFGLVLCLGVLVTLTHYARRNLEQFANTADV